jgi:hypothetical protein
MEAIIGFMSHILAELILVGLIALATFFLGRYYVTPKRCQHQKEECRKMIKEEFSKIAAQRDKCNDAFECEAEKIVKKLDNHITKTEETYVKKTDDIMHNVDVLGKMNDFAERMDLIYVRRDVVIPRLNEIHEELKELRTVLYKFIKINGVEGK